MTSKILYAIVPGALPPAPRPRAQLLPKMKWDEMRDRIPKARSMDDIKSLFRAGFYTPAKGPYRSWQKVAAWAFDRARRAYCGDRPFVAKGAPLEIYILVVSKLAKTHERKTIEKRPRRVWQTSHNSGDPDNLEKGILDAGNTILWHDDAQIARMMIETVRAEQNEEDRTEIMVSALANVDASRTTFERLREEARSSGFLVEAAPLRRGNRCPEQRTGDLPF